MVIGRLDHRRGSPYHAVLSIQAPAVQDRGGAPVGRDWHSRKTIEARDAGYMHSRKKIPSSEPTHGEAAVEKHPSIHCPPEDLDRGRLVRQRDRLRSDYVEVADGARLVLVRGQGHGLLCRRYRFALHTSFLL